MADQVWVLKILSGPHVGAEITLDAGQYSLGRHEECDLVLTDNTLDDYHLEILVSDDGVAIRNLAEGQGIYLNGKSQENAFALEPFLIVTAGNLHFAMAPENATWPELTMPDLTAPAPAIEETTSHESTQDTDEDEEIPVLEDRPTADEMTGLDESQPIGTSFIERLRQWRNSLPAPGMKLLLSSAGVLLIIVFISIFSWLWQVTDPTLAEAKKTVSHILEAENLRALQNLEDVTLKTLPDGSVLLTGYVVDGTTEQAYLDALTENTVLFNNQLIALDKLQENAMAVLNMRGYKTLSVELDTLPGTLILRGYLHTVKELTKVRELLQQEVHGLQTIIDQLEFQNTRIKALRSMLKSKGMSQRIKLLDQPGKVILKGRLMDISQGYHLKEVIRSFREKYGKRPELIIDVTLPSADLATLQPIINIKSVTIGKEPFVILDNGEKYLKGARLKNGYILESITLEYLTLRLGQERIKYYVGGNHAGN